MLDRYNSPNNNDYDNEAILSDPNWLEIVSMGQKVKDNLKKVLTSEEIQILSSN